MTMFDSALQLRDIGDGAEVADAPEVGIALDLLVAGNFKVHFRVSAADYGDADEVYLINIETDSELAFGDAPVIVGTLDVLTPGVGAYEIALSQEMIAKLDPDATHIRASLDVGASTTPSITYGAWIAPAA